ncbi:hypothetical protein VTN49DRAFT_5421 [Thermomyces lanuginosus]|uniref:uncharacterized protein n=1 Tax=Thermomyces lanuginosus TaxID=5541 RepID=UPI0037421C86
MTFSSVLPETWKEIKIKFWFILIKLGLLNVTEPHYRTAGDECWLKKLKDAVVHASLWLKSILLGWSERRDVAIRDFKS